MSMRFKVNFARYANGETRISVPQWLDAEDFAGAFKRASDMLFAMQQVDRESRYSIASIDAQYHGKECGGARMWETDEEMTTRIASGEN